MIQSGELFLSIPFKSFLWWWKWHMIAVIITDGDSKSNKNSTSRKSKFGLIDAKRLSNHPLPPSLSVSSSSPGAKQQQQKTQHPDSNQNVIFLSSLSLSVYVLFRALAARSITISERLARKGTWYFSLILPAGFHHTIILSHSHSRGLNNAI